MWQVAKRRFGDGGAWWWNRRAQPSAARRLTKAWGLLAIVGLLAALAAACGGGDEPQTEGTPTSTGGDAALAPCKALQEFKAYRYSVNLKLESPEPPETPAEPRPTPTSTLAREFDGPFSFEYTAETSFVAPDRIETVTTVDSGAPLLKISIGGRAWVRLADQWITDERPLLTLYEPLVVCEAVLPDLDLLQAEPQEEEVNGVKSLHYALPQVHSEQAWAKIFGPESDPDILLKKLDVDLWLAKEGNWPVRMEISSSGFYADGRELRAHLLVDTKDANSDDIRVEPPS